MFLYDNKKDRLPIIRERGFNFTSLPKIPNNITHYKLQGYFQSPKYFESKMNNICQILKLREKQNTIKNNYFGDSDTIYKM